jgi:hypothetical protein
MSSVTPNIRRLPTTGVRVRVRARVRVIRVIRVIIRVEGWG